VLAATIASAILLVVAFVIADAGQRDVLLWWAGRAWFVTGLWLVFGPLWEAGARATRTAT
jgi:hypothetical protein